MNAERVAGHGNNCETKKVLVSQFLRKLCACVRRLWVGSWFSVKQQALSSDAVVYLKIFLCSALVCYVC